MKALLTFCLALTLALPVFAQGDKDYAEAFHLIEVWLDAQADYENLPGLSAIVVEDQEVLWSGAVGYANPSAEVAASPSTIYSICSISKLFTAVAIMKLYDEGKLRLDDRIEELLPWYNLEQRYPGSGPITVRSLLTHSSGLPRESDYPYWSGPDFPFPDQAAVRAKLGEQETLYRASDLFQYSNLGLTLLGEIVEEVSGQKYEDYVRQHILAPLHLVDTRTTLPQPLYGTRLAIGHSAITRSGERHQVNLFQANGIAAAAGFSSTVEDLGKFASWQLRLLEGDAKEVLLPSTLDYMQRIHWTNPDGDLTWGLGFEVYKNSAGDMIASHGGSCPGYRSSLAVNPSKKRATAVMINASGTNPGKYARGMTQIMSKVETTADKPDTLADLSDYVGYYSAQPWWSERYISAWQDKLVTLSLPSDNPGESMTFYKHQEADTFRRLRDDGKLGEALVFERDADGKVIKVWSHSNYSRKVERP